jgi:hypothetical protein
MYAGIFIYNHQQQAYDDISPVTEKVSSAILVIILDSALGKLYKQEQDLEFLVGK